jgi:flagellar protein FliO/FliZ
MDGLLVLKFFSVFVFVMALMMLFAWCVKRFGLSGIAAQRGGERRLEIVESMALDQRRRLVLVRRDDREHLLVLGPEGETVVETGIPAAVKPSEQVVSFSRDQRNVRI